ncbi:DUF222 domain-containing protein [Actinomycetospora sp. OC33-EN08]|uniref:DUF222 domain-containing protein n=1 Tax=Actinomycetospora aurantiaca TaxID=3129233 RepID=A0ABU8MUU7_9PSEU
MTTAIGAAGEGQPPTPAPMLPVDPSGLPGQWVDEGMSRQFAAANTQAAVLCRWVLECSRAKAGSTERVRARPRSGKIVATSLGWSESYGASRIEFARQVLERLPRLGEEMTAGRLEERKAHDIVELVADLDDAQARAVVDEVVGSAPSLGFAELRRLVGRVAMAVDPQWAERRRAAAIARRRVALRSAPSGAVELCGLDLPEDPAQDAHDRIVALAHAVLLRLKRAGVRSVSVGEAESEVMLTLTGPAGAGMYDLDVVEHVTSVLGGPGPDSPSPDDGPGPDRPEPGPDEGPDDDGPDDSGPDDEPSAETGAPTETGSDPTAPVVFRARTVLRLELSTVLGLDQRPGELPGLGPISSDAATAMAWARAHGRWRVALYDPAGALDHTLSIRPPTTGPPPVGGRRRRHLVELTAHTSDLDALAARLDDPALPAPARDLLRRILHALARARARATGDHPATTTAEAGNRFPSTRLRDWVTARDRTCRAPGCAVDATRCDLDHTVSVLDGGRTVADDLGAFCRRDHRFKHDPDTGWTVTQPRPGLFCWTSPTGRVHHRRPHRYRRMPDPVARAGPRPRTPEHPPARRPPGTPRANQHGLVTDASLDTARHLHGRTDRTPYATDRPPF